jgi:hypothetical protein
VGVDDGGPGLCGDHQAVQDDRSGAKVLALVLIDVAGAERRRVQRRTRG